MELLSSMFNEYYYMLVAGLFGAIANEMSKKRITLIELLKSSFSSIFVGLLIGVSIHSFWETVDPKFLFVCSALSSYFSANILHEFKEIIAKFSDYFTSFFETKILKGNDDESKKLK